MLVPTEEQQAIINFAKNRTENLCINALAGAAKTSSLEMICNAVTNIPILYLAFNKRVVDEATKRLPTHVEMRTFNGIGHRVWSQATGKRLVIDTAKMRDILKHLIEDLPRARQGEAWEDFADTLRWLRYAKRDGYCPPKWDSHADPLVNGLEPWLYNNFDESPTDLQCRLIVDALGESIRQAYEGNIDYDDQIYMPCQPAGTKILKKNGEEVNIENIKEDDEVISFERKTSQFIGFYNHGSDIEAIASRQYTGKLFEISFRSGQSTKATLEHKWLARFIPNLARKDLWVTYLMFKEGSFKLGQCQIRSVRPDSSDGFGLAVRCHGEGAQQAWILAVHNSLQDAKLHEALNVIRFGITDCAFRSDIGEEVHNFQREQEFSGLWDRAKACLDYYGRKAAFPFWKSNETRAFNSNFITQSCNLIEGIMEIPLCEGEKTPNWQTFEVKTEFVRDLPVYSLRVKRHELYVANGILTHNCIFGAPWPKFPLVLCDEVQDLSPINHVMLEKLVFKRAIIVGDPWQSIYGFRGAVQNGMKRLVTKFNMTELPLSITFRVPKKGVERAHFRVPHMRAPEWQIDGAITTLERWDATSVPDGAAILCRNNAPLFSCALRLLRSGRSIRLVGMEIGPGLTRIMKKLGPLSMPPAAIDAALDQWLKRELAKAKSEHVVYEKYECLRVLCLRPDASSLGMAINFAEDLFKRQGSIQLLSIHKAKGLEFRTVFILDKWRTPSKWAKEGTEAYEQELNAIYVSETRFKEEMFFIDMEGFDG